MYQRVGKIAFKPNLNNTISLLEELGNPHEKFKSIHIAGTNGKGTSAHSIASILQENGYKVGLYTSPHLKSFTERIKINGTEIDENWIVPFVEKIRTKIELISPSFFEVTVAMAYEYFSVNKIDIAVVETGLGGRLDSTNVLMPEVGLITNIGLDHTDILGATLDKIAFEKAGIMKTKRTYIIGSYQADVAHVFEEHALTVGADLIQLRDEYQISQNPNGCFNIFKSDQIWLSDIAFDIKADYFLKNIPGILAVIEQLNSKGWRIEQHSIESGLSNVVRNTHLKGRFQRLASHPLIIADVSHNKPGILELLKQVSLLDYERLHIIYGCVVDKNVTEILELLPQNATYYFTQSQGARSLNITLLEQMAINFSFNFKSFQNVNQALESAKSHASANDLILVTGSTFIIAEIDEL
jgi:dihydrofolate synthase / folylpolyglutamate synthase